ncbi:hypothetical protein EV424DRAFT_453409 [Suillus variegatus]|nr:hypothetical protein EV424DRAFT_453409 [Suillus variegatus]
MSTYMAQPRIRITCFWQHDLRAIWNFGSASSVCQQLCTMMLGLYKTVLARGSRIALRRHRLSAGGGGLWLTLTHDALFAADERLLAIVRRGPMGSGKDKGVVMVNGTRVTVDVEELPEQEIKALAKRKHIKPIRIPLDQPPVVGVIRRQRAEWDADSDVPNSSNSTPRNVSPELPEPAKLTPVSTWLTSPKITSPRTKCCPSTIE